MVSLPLPDTHFQHCPPLSSNERKYLITKANEYAAALVSCTRNPGGPITWTSVGTYKGVRLFQGHDRTANSNVKSMCGVLTLMATLEEVASFFELSSTSKMKQFAKESANDVTDGAVLYTLVPRSSSSYYQVSIKWTAMQLPFLQNRDFVTLECQDTFVDSTGRHGWVYAQHSMQMPWVKEVDGFIRGSMYRTGYVVIESGNGYVDVVYTCQLNLKGTSKVPTPVFQHAMKKRIASIAKLKQQLQIQRVRSVGLLRTNQLVSKEDRAYCGICIVAFGLFTRRTQCRQCGDVVCGKCSATYQSTTTKIRICVKCVMKVRRMCGSTEEKQSQNHQEKAEATRSYGLSKLPPPHLRLNASCWSDATCCSSVNLRNDSVALTPERLQAHNRKMQQEQANARSIQRLPQSHARHHTMTEAPSEGTISMASDGLSNTSLAQEMATTGLPTHGIHQSFPALEASEEKKNEDYRVSLTSESYHYYSFCDSEYFVPSKRTTQEEEREDEQDPTQLKEPKEFEF